MIEARVTEAGVTGAITAFQSASLGETSWLDAIERLAGATGSRSGEVIGLGDSCVVPFNLMSGAAPDAVEGFIAAGGGDPAVNSRVRFGVRTPELRICGEADFTTDADVRLNPQYGDWVREHDMAQVCLTTLIKSEGLLVGMAIMRGRRETAIEGDAVRAFAAIAPHARRAVKTAMALEAGAVSGLVSGLEALRATAFICNAEGRVRAMTKAAEHLVSQGDVISLKGGCLQVRTEDGRIGLRRILASACAGAPGLGPPLRLQSSDGRIVRLAEASALPANHPLSPGTNALLIIHQTSADEDRLSKAAQACYGLSPAEGAIAAQLGLGRTVSAIARDRQVSVGTVRSQLRAIFAKTGDASQVELVARISRFG